MKILNSLFYGLMVMCLISCDDILEEDITNDMVQVTTPLSNAVIESNVVNFRWNALDGADKYRIQVYGNNQAMVLDTLVNPSSFTYPMRSGNFQWRIRGENSAYQSSYSFPISFTVIETDNLDNQEVILSLPRSGRYFNNGPVTCSWQSLRAAKKYELILTNDSNGDVITRSDLTTTQVVFSATELAQDAKYTWKVRAFNDSTSTLFFTRDFYLDRVVPNQPQISSPANNSRHNANLQIDFTWNIATDNGTIRSPISYEIEFSRESNFSSTFQTSTAINASFQQVFSEAGDYFWRVRAKDEASNVGAYSSISKFTVNPQ